MPDRAVLRAAYESACRQEIEALKPGNVHFFADGHRMAARQFIESARVSSGPLTDPALTLGARIREAVRATRETVGTNTNLGIILLCAPILRAAETTGQSLTAPSLRTNLEAALSAIDMADTEAVFEAIALASPGGLGEAGRNDVRQPPAAPLLEAMREAADRDLIARQYATGFRDVFDLGVPAISDAEAGGATGWWPALAVYLTFLTSFPDSHVARKHGPDAAGDLRREAAAFLDRLDAAATEDGRIALLLGLDASLKGRGLNPGTSADLTVACLLVHSLVSQLA